MADSIEQLGFELTSGVLGEQERAVSGMKLTAGTVLGAASIAVSLVAARFDGLLDAWAVLAAVAYILCFASAILVLLPRELVLSFSGAGLMADGDGERLANVSEAYRAASSWIEPYVLRNRRTIDRLADWLTISCLLLSIEVTLDVIGLAS
jgi:hypothetical protein